MGGTKEKDMESERETERLKEKKIYLVERLKEWQTDRKRKVYAHKNKKKDNDREKYRI